MRRLIKPGAKVKILPGSNCLQVYPGLDSISHYTSGGCFHAHFSDDDHMSYCLYSITLQEVTFSVIYITEIQVL